MRRTAPADRDMTAPHLKLDELEDLTEEELERLRGSFTRLASSPSDNALLRDAADGLETAGEEMQDAKEKVGAVAS